MTFKDGCNQAFRVGEENLDNYGLFSHRRRNVGCAPIAVDFARTMSPDMHGGFCALRNYLVHSPTPLWPSPKRPAGDQWTFDVLPLFTLSHECQNA